MISFRIDKFGLYSPRDSQKSSPAPQFKNINSSVLSFLYGPTFIPCVTSGEATALTMDVCQQSDVSPFKYAAFHFLPAVTLHSDFGTRENKSVTASNFPPSICHEVMGPDAMIKEHAINIIIINETLLIFFHMKSLNSSTRFKPAARLSLAQP